jgi:hypothetical protein
MFTFSNGVALRSPEQPIHKTQIATKPNKNKHFLGFVSESLVGSF